ncbi:MAG: hemolysin III family protein [Clostridia bacterium]|nr:hemolysin III family protein [Clostridia bacterium]
MSKAERSEKREAKPRPPLPPYSRGEEICNMVTHIVGGAFAVSALVLCVIMAAVRGSVWGVVSGAIYGASMILLYTMSSLYHGLVPERAKLVFRVIDHCTIYILIAGTYTPICLAAIRRTDPVMAWVLFGVIWGAAILAVTLTAVDMHKFKIFSLIAYVVMGWAVIVRIGNVAAILGARATAFLVAGGVLYTVGAVLYVVGKKKNTPYIHSVFHLFVLLGSISHFFTILLDVMPLR